MVTLGTTVSLLELIWVLTAYLFTGLALAELVWGFTDYFEHAKDCSLLGRLYLSLAVSGSMKSVGLVLAMLINMIIGIVAAHTRNPIAEDLQELNNLVAIGLITVEFLTGSVILVRFWERRQVRLYNISLKKEQAGLSCQHQHQAALAASTTETSEI